MDSSFQFISITQNRLVSFDELRKIIARVQTLLAIAEPLLEKLVDARKSSFWNAFPFLRRFRPPAEVEQILEIVRELRDKIGV